MNEKRTMYGRYEAVIGIEIHVQLNTAQKIFCFCKNEPGSAPNQHICAICCGYPSTLPLFNKEVLSSAIKAGLATNCVCESLGRDTASSSAWHQTLSAACCTRTGSQSCRP